MDDAEFRQRQARQKLETEIAALFAFGDRPTWQTSDVPAGKASDRFRQSWTRWRTRHPILDHIADAASAAGTFKTSGPRGSVHGWIPRGHDLWQYAVRHAARVIGAAVEASQDHAKHLAMLAFLDFRRVLCADALIDAADTALPLRTRQASLLLVSGVGLLCPEIRGRVRRRARRLVDQEGMLPIAGFVRDAVDGVTREPVRELRDALVAVWGDVDDPKIEADALLFRLGLASYNGAADWLPGSGEAESYLNGCKREQGGYRLVPHQETKISRAAALMQAGGKVHYRDLLKAYDPDKTYERDDDAYDAARKIVSRLRVAPHNLAIPDGQAGSWELSDL